jgi:hypothetical protein
MAPERGVCEDQRREFTSTLLKARTGHAALQADAKFTEIHIRPRLSLQLIKFQAEPCRRSRRVARPLRSLTD